MSLPHEPALDGLRGLAVAVVVLFHLGRLQGGFLGVDLFFVLSGFLITGLLATEHADRGRVDLRRFWIRRARRLLPALFLMLVGVALLLLRFTPDNVRGNFRDDALATLGYVANWQRMGASLGYWDIFSQPSPLDHTWSLAIEEQFYLVWPLVALLVLGRRRGVATLRLLAVAGAAVSLVLLASTYSEVDTNRAYFGTDTRLGPTLLGAALALFTVRRPRRDAPPGLGLELAGAAAVAWLAWSVVSVDGLAPWYYRGGLASFAAAAVVVVAVVTGGPPGRLARVISWRPLQALGIISYGVYLWHWPVIVYVIPYRASVTGWPLDLLRIATTLVVATASYVWVERPIRHGVLRAPRLRVAAAGGAMAVVVTVLVATSGTPIHTDPADTLESASSVGAGLGSAPATPTAASGNLLGRSTEYIQVPEDVPDGMPTVLLVGDSGASATGPSMVSEGEPAGLAVAFAAEILCSVVYPTNDSRLPDGQIWHRDCPSGHRRELWEALADQFDPDVIVYYLANAGAPAEEHVDGEWLHDCDPAYDQYLADALLDDFEVLGGRGARLVLATSPYVPMWPPDLVDCRNATYQEVVARRPDVQIVDLNRFVAGLDPAELEIYHDLIHLSPGASRRAAMWLFDQIPELDRAPREPRPGGSRSPA